MHLLHNPLGFLVSYGRRLVEGVRLVLEGGLVKALRKKLVTANIVLLNSSVVERMAVNHQVVGSKPT